MKQTTSALCAVFVLAAAPVFAGKRIQMEGTDLATNKVTPREILLDADRMRVDMGNSVVMFLSKGGNRMVMLDKARNEYRVMDQAMMDQMGQQFAGMTSQMEAAMKNMSPAQRAQMEQLLKGKLGGAAVPTTAGTTYVAKGGGTVNGFRCTNYDGTREGQKVSEICAAQPGELKIAASDFQVTEKMREFLAGMMKALQGSPMAGMISDQTFTPSGVSGFPVQTITLRNGQPVQREQVKSVADATFTDADFSTGTAKQAEIPAAPGARGKAKGK